MKNPNDCLAYTFALIFILAVVFTGGYITVYKRGILPAQVNDGEKQINYTCNYDRLTVDNCITEWECKTADILKKYEAGELQPYPFLGLDYDDQTKSYHPVEPVIEPTN